MAVSHAARIAKPAANIAKWKSAKKQNGVRGPNQPATQNHAQ